MYHVDLARAYSRKNKSKWDISSHIWTWRIYVKWKRKAYIFLCTDVYMMVNIVYTPSSSSKWVFTLGLLAEMRFRQSCFYSFFSCVSLSPVTVKLNAYNTIQLLIFSYSVVLIEEIFFKNQLELRWWWWKRDRERKEKDCS